MAATEPTQGDSTTLKGVAGVIMFDLFLGLTVFTNPPCASHQSHSPVDNRHLPV